MVEVIEPFYPKAGNGRRPYPLETMRRSACLISCLMKTEETMIDLVKKRVKGILTAGSFFAVNRAMIPFTKVDPKKVLFASDVRKEIGGNMTGEARPPTGQRSSSCSEETRRK